MFFFRKKRPVPPPQPVIECFVRYATYSSASAHKKRPTHFSYQKCHENLLRTADSRVHLTFFLDCAHKKEHFLLGKAIDIKAGTEAQSFITLLNYVLSLDLHPDTIVYFLEDDYLHRPGWVDILFEGFSLGVDYVTLYDHFDKYLSYPRLKSKIYVTNSCHWRQTPSTTQTFAMRFFTLKRDFKIHRHFSIGREVSLDHKKFCYLSKKGAKLISSIPGFATHADPSYLSPCIDWDPLMKGE